MKRGHCWWMLVRTSKDRDKSSAGEVGTEASRFKDKLSKAKFCQQWARHLCRKLRAVSCLHLFPLARPCRTGQTCIAIAFYFAKKHQKAGSGIFTHGDVASAACNMLQHGPPSRDATWRWSQSLDTKACTSTTEAMKSTGHKFAMLSSSCASLFRWF